MLYFCETSAHVITSPKAVELGLGYAFETPSIGSVQVDGGPGKKAGVVFSANSVSRHIRYKPEQQTWEPHPGKDGLWLGFWKDKRPGPQDLIRRKPKDGHFVELCDGQEWLIPVARATDGSSPLPRKLKRENGEWAFGDVEDAFKDYFAEACKLWDALRSKAKGEKRDTNVTIADAIDVCVMALAINYRLGVEEIALLGLLNTDNYFTVCEMILDLPALEELVKKNEASEKQSSTPGGAD